MVCNYHDRSLPGKPLLILLAAWLLCCSPLAAEMFRVHKTVLLQMGADGGTESVSAGINDAVAIAIPEDLTFVQGIEVLFKVPQAVSYWQDAVAWSIYSGLKKKPTERTIDYRGERIAFGTFANSLSLVLKVPISGEHSIKKDAYSYLVETVPDFNNGMLFIRMQLVMKGTSDEIDNALFEISAKPIYINKGRLDLSVVPPAGMEGKPYTVFIDGEAAEIPDGGLFLTPGQHNVSIVSEHFRNEMRTITVAQAKTMQLSIELRDIAPSVRIAAPVNTALFFDDKPLQNDGNAFSVTPGSHTIRFVIGGYELIKTITAVKGRSYTLSVNVDATVSEEE